MSKNSLMEFLSLTAAAVLREHSPGTNSRDVRLTAARPESGHKGMREFARLLFVGDIALGGDYARQYGQGSPNWTAPFVEIRPIFRTPI